MGCKEPSKTMGSDFVCGNGIGARSFINFGSATVAST